MTSELDDLEDDEVVTVYDVDTVLGYTVDILKVGYPFLILVALFLSLIFVRMAKDLKNRRRSRMKPYYAGQA